MTEETGLTMRETHLMPAMTLANAVERFNAVTRFTQQIMVSGRDYGVVPGSSKPTLLKPGAEKLTTFFGLSARPTLVEKVEDWTGADHGGEPFFYYWFRYALYRGDLLIAEADGSCNSWETKYRYRQGERLCPKCRKTAIRKDKKEHGGWYCWSKLGGCGATFKEGDATIEKQETGRVPNPNPADIANTVLKMAQKRALVAAVLLAANASEYYTQDLEDLDIIEGQVVDVTPIPAPEKPQPKLPPHDLGPDWNDLEGDPAPAPQPKASNGKEKLTRPIPPEALREGLRAKAGWKQGQRVLGTEPITEKQVPTVAMLLGGATDGSDQARHAILGYLLGVESTHQLTKREAVKLIDWLTIPGSLNLNEYAAAECAGILRQALIDQGQTELAMTVKVLA